MLDELGHIIMAVSDLSTCRMFYGDRLGLVELGSREKTDVCLFQIGPSVLELRPDPAADGADPLPSSRPIVDHFALYVDDLTQSHAALKEKNIPFVSEPAATPIGHRNMQRALATIEDPNGFHIQLSETIDPRPHLQGRKDAKRRMAAASSSSNLFGGFDHVSTYCSDFARTRDFYTRQLGLEEFFHSITREPGQPVVADFAQSAFAVGGTDIELAIYDTSDAVAPGAIRQLGFSTDDIDRAFQTLQDNGDALDGPPADCSPLPHMPQRAFTLSDPDGLRIQIAQAL